MRKLSILLVGAALAACQDASAPLGLGPDGTGAELSRSGSSDGPFVAGQVIARFTPGAAGRAIAAAHGARAREELRIAGVWLLEVPAGREQATVAALARNPNVVFAEPDWLLSTTPCGPDNCLSLNDPFFGRKWDLHNDGNIYNGDGSVVAQTGTAGADIDWLRAYTLLGRDFAGSAVIGILDTGIRGTHEDLAGKVVANRNFYGIGNVNPNQWSDSDGHGTHVAGIAAAHANNDKGVAGVGYGANIQLINARVCGAAGCPTSSIANAIAWAVDQGANVLNLSLGGPSPQAAIRTALADAEDRGVLAFCASGNNGTSSVSFPAAFPECVAVGSTTWSDTRASYSNWGAEVELSAPGGDANPTGTAFSYIASAYNNSNTSYVYMAGTSMATPQAAGLAALVYAAGLQDRAQLRLHLQNTADDLGVAGRDDEFGYGRVNAFRAVVDVAGNGGGGDNGGGNDDPPPPPPPADPLAASFSYSCGNSDRCEFTDTSTGDPTVWSWSFGGGATSTLRHPVHYFTSAGNHTVQLTVSKPGSEPNSASRVVSCSTHPRFGLRCK